MYERGNAREKYFAREYDMDSFHQLVAVTDCFIAEEYLSEEPRGLLVVDYWEWGGGLNKIFWPCLLHYRGILERIVGPSFDEILPEASTFNDKYPIERLVNVATLHKKNSPDN